MKIRDAGVSTKEQILNLWIEALEKAGFESFLGRYNALKVST